MSNPRGEGMPFYSAFARPGETLPGTAEEKQTFLDYIPFLGKNAASSASSTRANTNVPGTPTASASPDVEAGDGGVFDFAKRGMAAATGSARSVVTGVQQRTEEASFFLNSQRLMLFLFFGGVGAVFMFLAFLFLPMIVFAPQKFALFFTVGSACLVASLGVIRGFKPLIKHMVSRERLAYSIGYFFSLFFTLYASLFAHSYILTFVSAVIQLVALFSLLISYVPGGPRFLGFVKNQGVGAVKSVVPGFGGSQNSSLPI